MLCFSASPTAWIRLGRIGGDCPDPLNDPGAVGLVGARLEETLRERGS
jgi:hypothetical protein